MVKFHLLLALLYGPCISTGWVTKSVDGTALPLRWSVPSDELSTAGLGAGISWAIDPDFGTKMVPLFKENNFRIGYDFVSSEGINAAIQRAMYQWASNHKYLRFFNVSDKCNLEKLGAACSYAELYISADKAGAKYNYAPVKVFQTFNSTAGAQVTTTAGQTIDAKPILHADIVFYLDHPVAPDFLQGLQCFYLDETFCDPFHALQKRWNFKLMIEVVCFSLWGFSFLMIIKRAAEYVIGFAQKGWIGVMMIGRVHISHILYSYFIMLMAIFPPAFYWVAVYPCFLCYSFESLMLGAIGQVLGFDVANAPGAVNRDVSTRMGPNVCNRPDDYVVASAKYENETAMILPDPYDSRYCISSRDLDGLYYLYPLCNGAKLTPGCLRSKTNLGFLRVGLTFAAPFLIVSVVIFSSVAALRRIERKSSDNVKKRLAISAFASTPRENKRKKSLGGRAFSAMGGNFIQRTVSRRGSKAAAQSRGDIQEERGRSSARV